MNKVVFVTVIASSVVCLAVLVPLHRNSITLDLGRGIEAGSAMCQPRPGARPRVVAAALLDSLASEQAAPSAALGTAIVGELADGFGGLALGYASGVGAEVLVYDGTGGTGKVLASVTLDPTSGPAAQPPSRLAAIDFRGIARSFVVFVARGAIRLDQLRFEVVAAGAPPGPAVQHPAGIGLLPAGAGTLLATALADLDLSRPRGPVPDDGAPAAAG